MLPTKEDIKTEFKSCTNAISHSVYETVCSFLNHSGGTIYLGINDDGIIEGVNEAQAETLKKNLITAFNNKNLFFMSEIFDHSEMSEEDVKPKKITMETEIWNN